MSSISVVWCIIPTWEILHMKLANVKLIKISAPSMNREQSTSKIPDMKECYLIDWRLTLHFSNGCLLTKWFICKVSLIWKEISSQNKSRCSAFSTFKIENLEETELDKILSVV